jgi:nucleoside-diphosphate-sugar epimerase
MTTRVLVTGANGFVGSAICRALIASGREAIALVREGADTSLLPSGARVVHGEFHDAKSIARALEESKPEGVAHAAAVVSMGKPDLDLSMRINVEGLKTFLTAAETAGVRRWIQISSMSAHEQNKSVYGGTKWLADEALRASAMEWTILRPSIIYGPQRRGIFHKLTGLLRKLPVVPIVGSGREDMRPVHVDDVAGAVIAALDRPASVRGVYMLGCAEEMTCRDFFRETARQVRGNEPKLLPLPLWMCRIIAVVGEAVLPAPPITLDNVEGVTRAQRVDLSAAIRDLEFAPRPFREGLETCIAEGLLK